MARISTYQHDAVPHADDNVIGTNQSPGHASETVLFSLANLSNFLLVDHPQQQAMESNTTVMVGSMAPTSTGITAVPRTFRYNIDFGAGIYDNNEEPDVTIDPSAPLPEPVFTIKHNLGTQNVRVDVALRFNLPGETVPTLNIVSQDSIVYGYIVTIIDNNTIRLTFTAPDRLIGLATITG